MTSANTDPRVLFHYSPVSAFHSIISGQNLRLSLLDVSNDYMEGRWIHEVLRDVFQSNPVTARYTDVLLKRAELAISFPVVAAFCLSEEADQLGQWRGYADDGRGFSIGFHKTYFEILGHKNRDEKSEGFAVQKVHYSRPAQDLELEPILKNILLCIQGGALAAPHADLLAAASDEDYEATVAKTTVANKNLSSCMASLMFFGFWFKNPAFTEEKEWRIMRYVFGNESVERKASLGLLSYHAARDRLVPYVDLGLQELKSQAIASVTIGPKNRTPIEYVSSMMCRYGFNDVKILKSTASYR